MSDDATVYFELAGMLAESRQYTNSDLVSILGAIVQLVQKWPGEHSNTVTILQLLALRTSLVVFPVLCLVEILTSLPLPSSKVSNSDFLVESNDWGEVAQLLSLRLKPDSNNLYNRSSPIVREETVNELQKDISQKCRDLGWITHNTDDVQQRLFLFCKVYTCRYSEISRDLRACQPLFDLVSDYDPFKRWLEGIVEPHLYYSEVCENIVDDCVNLRRFDSLTSVEEQLSVLYEPLGVELSSNIPIDRWIIRVLLPLTKFHNCGLDPILNWMVNTSADMKLAEIFTFWNKCISAILLVGSSSPADSDALLKRFLAIAYYYSLTLDSKSTSMAILSSYDLIRSTLQFFLDPAEVAVPHADMNNSLKDIKLDSFDQFLRENPLVIQPNAESVHHLLSIIETCSSLYPINKLTISGYFQLMTSEVSSEKEVTKILSGVNAGNCTQLLSSVDSFVSTFMGSEQLKDVNKAVLERLLVANLFEESKLFASSKNISHNVISELVMAKFWDSFNSASSMNENMDGLKHAHECIKIMDGIEGDHSDIVGVKHLLKAISNLKNFKILVNGQKIVPAQVISKFGASSSQLGSGTPMTLITLILEQNPKSYLAFGKLHKILNDLGIFFGHNLDHSFSKLNSVCIESALIDNNFSYAYKRSKELFSHYKDNSQATEDIGEYWLTFYQVGKYALPDWINDLDGISDSQLQVLIKQREILSTALIYCRSNNNSVGNSKLLLRQWEIVNDQIDMYYQNLLTPLSVQQETTVVNNLLSEAANTTHQTSEKISKLFASGLGWALGANPS